MCGTAAEISAVNSVDDRPIPCPGPMTKAIAEVYARAVRGQEDQYKDWCRACRLNRRSAADGAADAAAPTQVEIFDTTLRDGCQVEGVSADRRGQAAHRRAARPASASTTSRAAGRAPTRRTIEFFRRAATELQLDHVDAGRLRLDPPPEGQGRRRPDAAQPGRGRHLGRLHRRPRAGTTTCTEALQTTLDEGEAMIADSVEFLRRARPAGAVRRRALLRRLQAQPRVRPAGARGGGREGRQPPRAVRHQRRLAAARGRGDRRRRARATSATTSIIGIHTHDDTGCAVANSMAAVRAGARHVQGTHQRARRAHRQLQPHDGHPQPHAEAGRPHACPRAASSG